MTSIRTLVKPNLSIRTYTERKLLPSIIHREPRQNLIGDTVTFQLRLYRVGIIPLFAGSGGGSKWVVLAQGNNEGILRLGTQQCIAPPDHVFVFRPCCAWINYRYPVSFGSQRHAMVALWRGQIGKSSSVLLDRKSRRCIPII